MSDIGQIVARRRMTIDRVKALLIDSLQLDLSSDEIADDAALFGFGLALDSIDALTIVVAIEDAFGMSIPEDDFALLRSINTIADFVETRALGTSDDGMAET